MKTFAMFILAAFAAFAVTGAIPQSPDIVGPSTVCADGKFYPDGDCPAVLSDGIATAEGQTTAQIQYTVDQGGGSTYACVLPVASSNKTTCSAVATCSDGIPQTPAPVDLAGVHTFNLGGLTPATNYRVNLCNQPPIGFASNLLTVFVDTLSSGPRTFYVDATAGNDSNTGTAEGDAWRTLSKVSSQTFLPGDMIFFRAGETYTGTLTVNSNGNADSEVYFGVWGSGSPPVIRQAVVNGNYVTFDDLLVDGNKGAFRALVVTGDNFTLRDSEVRNVTRNCVELNGSDQALFQRVDIHHCLNGNWDSDPIQDAHGIAITANAESIAVVLDRTNIYQVSGDAIQSNPNRPSESNFTTTITWKDSSCWTAPLEEDFNAGWPAGRSPGENCIDTKANVDGNNKVNIYVENVNAWGFTQDANTPPAMSNRALFNMKENVTAVFNRVTTRDSEIAYRIRGNEGSGNANVTVMNAVLYDLETAIRAESSVANLKWYNSTFGTGIDTFLHEVSGGNNAASSDLKNNVFIGTVPSDFSDNSNVQASEEDFFNAAEHDYRPLDTAEHIVDAGVDLLDPEGVTVDRDDNPRDATPNIGAYEVTISTGQHAFFNMLKEHPGMLLTKAFSSATLYETGPSEEIEDTYLRLASGSYDGSHHEYDPVLDAMAIYWPPNQGSKSSTNGGQIRWGYPLDGYRPKKEPPAGFGSLGNGTWFASWEFRFDSNWEIQNRDMTCPIPNSDRTHTHKAFQFARLGGDITLEPRFRYGSGSNQCRGPTGSEVAGTDIRLYGGGGSGPGNSMPGVQNCVFFPSEQWFRLMVFIDNSGAEPRVSYWVDFSEDDQGPIAVYDNQTGPVGSVVSTLTEFWVELNTSQECGSGIFTDSYMWFRNWAILGGLNYSQAAALAAQSSW